MNKLGNIPVVSCFNGLFDPFLQPFKDSWRNTKEAARKRLDDIAYGATSALDDALSNTPFQVRSGSLGYQRKEFNPSRFIGSPTDPAPISWNRHRRPDGHNPSNDYTALTDSFNTYGGPVTSLYSAINGLRDTVNNFIDITKEEQAYFKAALSHEAKQIQQYFRFLNDPVFRQMHHVNPKQYKIVLEKMLGKVGKAVKAEQAKISSVYGGALDDAWNIISQVASEIQTPAPIDRSIAKMLSAIGRGERDAWINDPAYHKYLEAESRGVPGKKVSAQTRPLSKDEEAGMAFMMAGLGGANPLDPKKYGKYAGQQKAKNGFDAVNLFGGWDKIVALEKYLRGINDPEARKVANILDKMKQQKQQEQRSPKGGKGH